MSHVTSYPAKWENDEVRVDIPFSAAGVSTSIVLTSKFTGKYLIADIGDGLLRDFLSLVGTDFVEETDMICITHGHFDHMGGLHSLLGFLRIMKRTSPLDILIPAGSEEVLKMVRGFRDCYRDTTEYQIRLQEVRPGVGFDTDFFKVNVYEVEHFECVNAAAEDKLMPAVGYRVRIGETVVAYTGDTRICDSARELVTDADLAIIEATHDEHEDTDCRVHLTTDEANELASLAKASMIVHRIPELSK